MRSKKIVGLAAGAVAVVALACGGKGDSGAKPAGSGPATNTPAGGTAAAAAGTSTAAHAAGGEVANATGEKGNLPPNPMGRIPVLEYHVIGGAQNALYTRTVASFKQDLEDVYRRNYRPITVAQMLDKDFRDVPPGMSPVIFVFDDASPSQFSYIEQNGKLTIDPNSAVGIWLDFAKSHPGWKTRGTFCMLNGGAAGHNFFGDNPKYGGQKKEWRFQKVQWLAQNGFELCDHTLWHAKLNQYPDNVVQEQIARNAMGIDSAVPGYNIRTMALPYGLWPKNKSLAWQGSWTDPKTGKVHPYHFQAVLEVAGGPTRSPYDPQFDPHHITRVQAVGNDIARTLDALDKGTGASGRFVAKQ